MPASEAKQREGKKNPEMMRLGDKENPHIEWRNSFWAVSADISNDCKSHNK